jgi:hypothetical protein
MVLLDGIGRPADSPFVYVHGTISVVEMTIVVDGIESTSPVIEAFCVGGRVIVLVWVRVATEVVTMVVFESLVIVLANVDHSVTADVVTIGWPGASVFSADV